MSQKLQTACLSSEGEREFHRRRLFVIVQRLSTTEIELLSGSGRFNIDFVKRKRKLGTDSGWLIDDFCLLLQIKLSDKNAYK